MRDPQAVCDEVKRLGLLRHLPSGQTVLRGATGLRRKNLRYRPSLLRFRLKILVVLGVPTTYSRHSAAQLEEIYKKTIHLSAFIIVLDSPCASTRITLFPLSVMCAVM